MNRRTITPFLIAAILSVSCATGPKNFKKQLSGTLTEFGLFQQDALCYGYIKKTTGKEMWDSFLSDFHFNENIKRFVIDKTNEIFYAVYKDEDRYSLSLLLRGKGYPALKISTALNFSSEWRKIKTKKAGAYWKSKTNNSAIAVRSNALLILFGNIPDDCEYAKMPPDFEEFQKNAAAAGWMPSDSLLNNTLREFNVPLKLPMQNMSFAVFRRERGFETIFKIDAPNESQAKLIASIFTIMRNNKDSMSSLLADYFLANPAQITGKSVIITTAPMSAEHATGLMNLFLLESGIGLYAEK
ncbi:MAG: hypothetical protein LBD07_01905 [Spirochaetaceae bacterium]|jgi:hypothetical protein|nr:hypothetical protein [Spirochaetaceae bacterium]